MSAQRWTHFRHGADVGMRGCGDTLEAAFAAAAEALTAAVADLSDVQPEQAIHVACDAPDRELLLVDWLNALIYEMAVRRWLFRRFDITIEDSRLSATVWGEPVDVARHKPAVEVKGATYTALRVEQNETGDWCAQCVVDV